ncbi:MULTISPECIES: sensor histidine kinase [unclassified Undibacterium]|uniref:sensor histidine kinase n=1 Tax=unclassified Undibacterium TaxID=2630295 RepID=UPI002AC9E5FD|nr:MULTISPECIES: histidine kinase [unclassified Undibacterium]MEB0138034.1 histidine kinase [Undibacterium sp. CCC2.1]MEB0171228.1 histidine kinase [Undibacterium sp. CCC1.1]MEB0175273.1 histidine kinase [Undibacterium sp. CCC3.4]MEB0214681.1 histidine kinase [Undibacterium sp. 5I2]WPX42448.1 histidine kinase [Undibacterium sp. CCC3.4]
MNPHTTDTIKDLFVQTKQFLSLSFDKTAAWVTKLSWWKFFIFAMITLLAGAILQDLLFTSEESVVVTRPSKKNSTIKNNSDSDTSVEIDSTGIRIHKNHSGIVTGEQITIDEHGIRTSSSDTPATPLPPMPPATASASLPAAASNADIHIKLPPEVAQALGEDLKSAVADAADEEVRSYKKTSSKWFANFVLLLVFCLFGMKILMGGKVRAEEKARSAGQAAEREALLRQVSQAQMQTMQAQVEPHFLFNTLASVEHLIITDPPRAAAMQRSLISYLRAVLPQIRENAPTTNLGREADMVGSYLDLLKMRMEERLTVDLIMPTGLRSAAFPPMMLQSLVENAIKHGLESKADGGTIVFRAEVADHKLRVSVSDNGLGFGAVPSTGTGLGLQNIRERLKLLYQDRAQMIITPNQPSGVCVTIEIPYEPAK